MPKKETMIRLALESDTRAQESTHSTSGSRDDDLCESIDAVVNQLHEEAKGDQTFEKITLAERCRREAAVKEANASLALEGFKPSKEAEERARRFINGEIDLPTLLRENSRRNLKPT